ncbi:hypothetical protein [Actinomadura rupiterrae]|uniref:hypothetical protein n=1 Tax=Actinomadura rupiterrae TaxID=559627 RepID=UPI0020A2609A|nr:hypothetical protein [Actinomadura rupiterrae]MCP2336400.1 hypothetical protein [Actinomadura rupiterrae]
MAEVLTFLLLRLAIVVGGILLLAVIAITLLVMLKRHGQLARARSFAEPVVRGWAERPPSDGGGALRRAAMREALDRLDRAESGGRSGSAPSTRTGGSGSEGA